MLLKINNNNSTVINDILNNNNISQYNCFTFDQINSALVSKNIKKS